MATVGGLGSEGMSNPVRAQFSGSDRGFAVIGTSFVEIDGKGAMIVRGTIAADASPVAISSHESGQLFVSSAGHQYSYDIAAAILTEVSEPLHVQVARALGLEVNGMGGMTGVVCGRQFHNHQINFDTDWSVTGPLIERYGIDLGFALSERHEHRFEWIAHENVSACRCVGRLVWDKSPLVAVCRLLIDALPNGMHKCSREALAAAGKPIPA